MYADGRRLPVEDDNTFGGMILLLVVVFERVVASRCVMKRTRSSAFVFFENFFEFFDKTRGMRKNASFAFLQRRLRKKKKKKSNKHP